MANAALDTYGGLLQAIGIQGAIADGSQTDIMSLANSGATAIDLGNAVAQGSSDLACKAPAADGDKIIGLAARHAAMASNSSAQTLYAQYDEVPVVRKGDLFVYCTEAYAVGDAVLSKTASTGAIGSTTGGAAGVGRIAVPGATFLSSGLANTVAKVRINN
jgi:hypothetical protein